jgi:hypothetical protein
VWNTDGTEGTIVKMGSSYCGSTVDTLNMPLTTFVPGVSPPTGASDGERMEFLHRQLDSLHQTRLLDRFVLVGPQGRRQGGALHPLPHPLRGEMGSSARQQPGRHYFGVVPPTRSLRPFKPSTCYVIEQIFFVCLE